MTNNHIRYYISYLNLTGTVKHNSTNKSFIYCLWIPFCKLFKPCNRVGSSGKNSWYSRSWLPKTRFWLQFDLVFKLPKLWSQYLANYFQNIDILRKQANLHGPNVTCNNNEHMLQKQLIKWRKVLLWIPYWERKRINGGRALNV